MTTNKVFTILLNGYFLKEKNLKMPNNSLKFIRNVIRDFLEETKYKDSQIYLINALNLESSGGL